MKKSSLASVLPNSFHDNIKNVFIDLLNKSDIIILYKLSKEFDYEKTCFLSSRSCCTLGSCPSSVVHLVMLIKKQINQLLMPMYFHQILRLWIIQFLEMSAQNRSQVTLLTVYLKMTNMGIWFHQLQKIGLFPKMV